MNLEGRRYLIYFLVAFTGVFYLFRLFYMQILDGSWAARASQISERKREVIPPRGIVLDRNGKQVVSNKTSYNIMMIESKITQLDTAAFAALIGWDKQKVIDRFKEIRIKEGFYKNSSTGKTTSNYRKDRPYPFVKEISPDEMLRIAPQLSKFPGFYEEPTHTRFYPYPYAANIFGYLNEVIKEEVEKDPFLPAWDEHRAGGNRAFL